MNIIEIEGNSINFQQLNPVIHILALKTVKMA